MNIGKIVRSAAAFAALICLSPVVIAQEEDVVDDDMERCIRANVIRSTEVIDDYRIIFFMRGSDVYLNQLPRRCGGLGSQRRFSYRTTTGQLCNLDWITVLHSGGMGPGMTCALGKFRPITEEEAEALQNAEPAMPEPEELPTAEPEEIGEPQ